MTNPKEKAREVIAIYPMNALANSQDDGTVPDYLRDHGGDER
jgi:hypothetical protein